MMPIITLVPRENPVSAKGEVFYLLLLPILKSVVTSSILLINM